jgi:hypothetical protein
LPYGREVVRERKDALALVVIDRETVSRALALIFGLGLSEISQPRVPIRFQRISHKAVGGVDLHITMTGVVRFVLCALDLSVAQPISFGEAGLDLFLHGDCRLKRNRGDRLDQQLCDRGVDLGTEDTLTHGVAEEATPAYADVVGDELATASLVVVDMHSASAKPANGAAL